jgi:hypothetical protein
MAKYLISFPSAAMVVPDGEWGAAELVVQHADAYQKLLDLAASAAAIVGIQRGLQGMYDGTSEDAEDAFASLERELGIAEQA